MADLVGSVPTETERCEHVWQRADLHICPSIATATNRHVRYSWGVCSKCGEGSRLAAAPREART